MHRITTFALLSLLSLADVYASPIALNTTNAQRGPIATTWYASWHADSFPLDKLSWKKYTSVTYAFGLPTADPSVIDLAESDQVLLPQFVAKAHENRVKATLSVGGWTGSRYFSNAVSTPENRAKFLKAITDIATKYKLDGIDFDWEYPNHQGIGCNVIAPTDTPNFLTFLQELRKAVPKDFLLSAAVFITPFADANGNPSTDVSGFAKVLDYIAIMNYDIWGPWSTAAGPNAPLDDSCVATPSEKQGSATSAVAAWTQAGFPANQISLGVAAYGHSVTVDRQNAYANAEKTELAAYPPFDASVHQPGDRWDDAPGVDICGVQGTWSGNWDFWGLVDGGFLTKEGKPANGIGYRYDNCSQTPYVYNSTTQVMVSFDDAKSFAAKGHFIKSKGLHGFAMWEAGGDYNDILLNSIRGAVGL